MIATHLMDLQTVAGYLLAIVLIALFVTATILMLFFAQKHAHSCFKELKRQNQILELQAQSIDEMNRWMRYFNDRLGKKEAPQKPKGKTTTKAAPPTPISRYKKTI